VVSFTSSLIYPHRKSLFYPFSTRPVRPQRWFGFLREEINISPLLGIKPQFLRCPGHTLVMTPTMLCRNNCISCWILWFYSKFLLVLNIWYLHQFFVLICLSLGSKDGGHKHGMQVLLPSLTHTHTHTHTHIHTHRCIHVHSAHMYPDFLSNVMITWLTDTNKRNTPSNTTFQCHITLCCMFQFVWTIIRHF